ncbi:unnamed protein product [Umbelopsis ramanniana]
MTDTIRTPILISAARVCFHQCAPWIVLCGGVGLAASIIEHNRTPSVKIRVAEKHIITSENSLIKIMQAEKQQSLLERLSPDHRLQAYVLHICATAPPKNPRDEEVEVSQEKESSHHKEPRVLKKRCRPSKKEIWPLRHLRVSSGHKREWRLQKKYKSRSKHQSDRWRDAIDAEEYVNPHLIDTLQSNESSLQKDNAMTQNLITLLLLVHTGLWNLSLSYMQLTAVVY